MFVSDKMESYQKVSLKTLRFKDFKADKQVDVLFTGPETHSIQPGFEIVSKQHLHMLSN